MSSISGGIKGAHALTDVHTHEAKWLPGLLAWNYLKWKLLSILDPSGSLSLQLGGVQDRKHLITSAPLPPNLFGHFLNAIISKS